VEVVSPLVGEEVPLVRVSGEPVEQYQRGRAVVAPVEVLQPHAAEDDMRRDRLGRHRLAHAAPPDVGFPT
jgi:hypothetical protein